MKKESWLKKYQGLCILLLFCTVLCACSSKEERYQEQYDLGMKYLSEGSYEEAIIAFEAAIEIDPRQTGAYFSLAEIYEEIWQTEKAIAQLERLLEVDEQNVDGYLRLAELYHSLGELDKAREILRQGYELTNDTQLAEKLEFYLVDIETRLTMIGEDSFELRMKKADMVNYQAEVDLRNRLQDTDRFIGVIGWDCGFTWDELDMRLKFHISERHRRSEAIDFTLDELNSMSDTMLMETFNVVAFMDNVSDPSRHASCSIKDFESHYSLCQDGEHLLLTVNNVNDLIWHSYGGFSGNIADAIYQQQFCESNYTVISSGR